MTVEEVSARRIVPLAASAFVVLAAEPLFILIDTAGVRRSGKIERGIELQQFEPRIEKRTFVGGEGQHRDVAIGFGQRNRHGCAGDDDALRLGARAAGGRHEQRNERDWFEQRQSYLHSWPVLYTRRLTR